MRYMRWLGVLGAVAIAVLLTACGGGETPSASNSRGGSVAAAGVHLGTADVEIAATDQLAFSPASTTARTSQIVEWKNTGSVSHTVTFDQFPDLTDASLQAGSTWQVRFTTPGTYTYHCTIHAGMTGTIVVS